jgi:LDH2 family malate/lactate/ureidoglycolate dehydrogenase
MKSLTKLSAEELRRFAGRCLAKLGVPEEEAALIAETMVEADARGIHSHGLMRLPVYAQRIRKGYIFREVRIVVEAETNTTLLLDGCFSAGQVAGTRAMELAIEKAESQGLGAVAIKNSNHFGIAARYALLASRRDLVGIAMSNTTPLVPPAGGAEKTIGNNPIAIAVPSNNEYPFVLDMALSSVALGKILFARSKGASIPDTWGVDKSGAPTTDPSEVLEGGFITPAAGPKGFGLALIVEALTGILADGAFAKEIPSMYDLTQRQSVSHFMLAIDPARFIPINVFRERMSLLSAYVKEAKKAEGVDEIFLPGEMEFSLERERLKSGIPVEESVLKELKELALALEVPLSE